VASRSLDPHPRVVHADPNSWTVVVVVVVVAAAAEGWVGWSALPTDARRSSITRVRSSASAAWASVRAFHTAATCAVHPGAAAVMAAVVLARAAAAASAASAPNAFLSTGARGVAGLQVNPCALRRCWSAASAAVRLAGSVKATNAYLRCVVG
jgi:hypothetical protein